ncbi:MAG: triose-phosphate isomerase [Patescibacteria group bacterium]
MLWINFKIYSETFGEKVFALAEACYSVAKASGIDIIPVVSAIDLRAVKQKFSGPVWVQSADPFLSGAHTGWISPQALVEAGADGILLNHSEHRLPPGIVNKTLSLVNKNKLKLETMVCFKSQGQARGWIKKTKSDFVAYEPPELIGGDVSVSQAKPELIKKIAMILPKHKLVVGAGVKNGDDVSKALKLGAVGVLVSSGVVKAKDPKKILTELANAFKNDH